MRSVSKDRCCVCVCLKDKSIPACQRQINHSLFHRLCTLSAYMHALHALGHNAHLAAPAELLERQCFGQATISAPAGAPAGASATHTRFIASFISLLHHLYRCFIQWCRKLVKRDSLRQKTTVRRDAPRREVARSTELSAWKV
jgi:hypothetical protein